MKSDFPLLASCPGEHFFYYQNTFLDQLELPMAMWSLDVLFLDSGRMSKETHFVHFENTSLGQLRCLGKTTICEILCYMMKVGMRAQNGREDGPTSASLHIRNTLGAQSPAPEAASEAYFVVCAAVCVCYKSNALSPTCAKKLQEHEQVGHACK